MRVFRMPFAFDPNQPRDERGRWASTGAGVAVAASDADVAHHDRWWGSNDLDALFPGGGAGGTMPFPRAGRLKSERQFDRDRVLSMLAGPVEMVEVDPRALRSTQRGITREGVAYYMTDEWRRTGRTFADQADPGNAFPIIQRRERTGEYLIVSGHHRAAAAALQGRPLEVRIAD